MPHISWYRDRPPATERRCRFTADSNYNALLPALDTFNFDRTGHVASFDCMLFVYALAAA